MQLYQANRMIRTKSGANAQDSCDPPPTIFSPFVDLSSLAAAYLFSSPSGGQHGKSSKGGQQNMVQQLGQRREALFICVCKQQCNSTATFGLGDGLDQFEGIKSRFSPLELQMCRTPFESWPRSSGVVVPCRRGAAMN